jgi:hypothetical protein
MQKKAEGAEDEWEEEEDKGKGDGPGRREGV